MRAATEPPTLPERLGDVWQALNDIRRTFASDIAAVMPDDWTRLLPEDWTYSFSLDHVPDAVAWLVVIALAIYLFRLVLVHRPRLCAFSAFVWLSWLSWDVGCVHGVEALVMMKARGLVAMGVTAEFTKVLVELVRAWTHFFLPFMNDLASGAAHAWSLLTLRQRLGVLCFIAAVYGIGVTIQLFWRHQRLVKKTLFHASFLIFGPAIWHLCALIDHDWYSTIVTHAVTTMPAVMSMVMLSWVPQEPETKPRSGAAAAIRARGDSADTIPTTNQQMLRLWLSYWTCWPVLSLLKVLIERVPRLVGSAGVAHAAQLQSELQRAMITFVVWIMLWQGSRLLNLLLRACFFNTGIWENIAWFFGARGVEALIATKGGVVGALVSFSPIRMTRIIGKISSRLWLVGIFFFLAVSVVCLLLWVFYSAVSIVSQALTMLLWIFAALDSADALTQHAEGFYYRKLAFWVLAMLWELVVTLPYAGAVLNIFTPIAFALFFVAGEFLLKRIVLPVFVRARGPLKLIFRMAGRAVFSQNRGVGAVTDEDAEQEDLATPVATPRTVPPMMLRLLAGSPSPKVEAAKDLPTSSGKRSPRRSNKLDIQVPQQAKEQEEGEEEEHASAEADETPRRSDSTPRLPEVPAMPTADRVGPTMGTKAPSSDRLSTASAEGADGAADDASPVRKTSSLRPDGSSTPRKSLKTGTKGKKAR